MRIVFQFAEIQHLQSHLQSLKWASLFARVLYCLPYCCSVPLRYCVNCSRCSYSRYTLNVYTSMHNCSKVLLTKWNEHHNRFFATYFHLYPLRCHIHTCLFNVDNILLFSLHCIHKCERNPAQSWFILSFVLKHSFRCAAHTAFIESSFIAGRGSKKKINFRLSVAKQLFIHIILCLLHRNISG